LAFDLICDLDIVIWNLPFDLAQGDEPVEPFGPILRSSGACNLLFPVYPG
jgi:hypothetical protein